uniref:Uncharacterized protein n=1 Tax=viral metagenome TaxID=1070528 RepID=A0A6M3KH52_9ZZZZ
MAGKPGNLNFYHLMNLPADKEVVVTRIVVFGEPTLFTSNLSGNHTRKTLSIYNNTHTDSGEVLWGNSDCNVNGMVVPKGTIVNLPIADTLAGDGETDGVTLYLCGTVSGEYNDVRVAEFA